MNFKKNFLLCVLIGSLFTSCELTEQQNIHQLVKQDTNEVFDRLVQIRRDFHEHPELAGKEKRTSNIIAEYLTHLGLEVKTGFAGHAVMGILKGGKEGGSIAWRADMDALPNIYGDNTSLSTQKSGKQHGCGHDVHMAIGLGIASVLAKNKEAISGTIYFIFQPEEETFTGAKKILHSDLFSKIHLDEIYALHVTDLPVGKIMVKPKEPFAYQKRIQLTFHNTLKKMEAATLYTQIRSQMLRKKPGGNPWELPMVFDAASGLNNLNTVFKDYLFLEENVAIESTEQLLHLKAYLYETDASNLEYIVPKIEEIIGNSKHKEKFISASFIQENPTVINKEALTKQAIQTLNDIYGTDTVVKAYGQIPYFNDDFCYFQETTPGVYFFLGGTDKDKGIRAMNHTPHFDVDEESIRIGVRSFSSLILERANKYGS